MKIPAEIVQAGKAACQRYVAAKRAGESENMACIIAMRCPPGTRYSERAFLEGTGHNPFGKQSDFLTKVMLEDAKKAGIDTTGKVFKSGLADGRGFRDPLAWVSSLADVKRVCELRNRSCEGAVSHKSYRPDPTPDIPLADDIIEEFAVKEVLKNPETVRKMTPLELKEKIIHEHGAPARGGGTDKPRRKPKVA